MFRGRYEHSVDAKGRLALPARFREVLSSRYQSDRLVATRHLSDPCLVVYPLAEWEEFEDRLGALSQMDPAVTLLRRLYVGTAQETSFDKQGRLLIAPDLRRDAAIDKQAVWSGAGRFIELWGSEQYHQHVEAQRARLDGDNLQAVLSKLAELGV